MSLFSGIWVPIVTPFRQAGAGGSTIDVDALARLAERLAGSGAAGLVVCGSTGEAAALDEAEQLLALDTVLEAVRCPVVMGLSAANQRTALERQQALQKRSIAGLLAAPPAYIKPSQDGLIAYFRALADAANVPLLLYNIPYRTGVGIALASYLKLAEHPRIVATKDCGGDPLLTMKLIADGRIAVLAGEDAQLLSSLALGASGAILASAHIRTDFFASLFEQVRRGDLEAARRTFYRLLPLMELLFAEPNPGPLKSALAMMGWMEEVLREPMLPASPALREKLGAELRRLECL